MVYADPVFGTYDRFDFIISSEREKTIGLVAYHPLKRIHSLAIHSWFLISLSVVCSLHFCPLHLSAFVNLCSSAIHLGIAPIPLAAAQSSTHVQ